MSRSAAAALALILILIAPAAEARCGDCDPGCDDCSCCSAPRPLALERPATEPAPAVVGRAADPPSRLPAAPPPGEILHVPRPFRA